MQHELDTRYRAVATYVAMAASSGEDELLKSYLYRFGAVLICGNIERSIEIIILSRLHTRAQPRVLSFIKSHFSRGHNFDCEAIQQLLNRFDADWYRRFGKFADDNPDVKEGVSSCYAIRNSAAHGGSQGVGMKRLKELLEIHKRLLDGVVTATA